MDSHGPETATLIEEVKSALRADDAERVRAILGTHPALKALINEPIGPFDSPSIGNACSRKMLDVLLEAGADINARSRWWAGGFGLLDTASPDLAAYAIERGAIVDVHAASRLGLMDRLRELMTLDPSAVDARGGDGQTPLHFAKTVGIAAYLLDHGADIDARDVDHESTPAQHMVCERQDVARYLMSRGCQSDLLMAAALGDVATARRQLDADPACIRVRVSDEFFPMINPKAGGTIYQWTLGFYVSAHQVARKFGHEDVLELLLERSPADVKLIDACWMADESKMQAIRSEHPDIVAALSATDHLQVAYAARNNQTPVVRLMLECGWPVDATSQHRATPLHWAAFNGNADMTTMILRFDPPLEATDADFNGTPLRWAVYGSEHGWFTQTGDYGATVEALIRAGATRPAEIEGSPVVQDVLRRFASNARGTFGSDDSAR